MVKREYPAAALPIGLSAAPTDATPPAGAGEAVADDACPHEWAIVCLRCQALRALAGETK
jgi:hypothetical protein